MVKRSTRMLVSTKTKCIKLIFIGKITLVPVAFLMALSIESPSGPLPSLFKLCPGPKIDQPWGSHVIGKTQKIKSETTSRRALIVGM